jgi:tetratricopeptide (TPR) repeat protein
MKLAGAILSLAVLAPTAATAGCAARPNQQARNDVRELPRGQSLPELMERGRAFAAVGDLTRAEQYLSAALQAGANPQDVLPALLHVCVESKRYRVAAEYVGEYLRRNPDSTSLRLLHGSLEAAVGDRAVALREYEYVLRARPDDSEGHYAIAVLLRDSLDDPGRADEHFREYLRISPDGAHASEARASLLEHAP